MQTPNYGSGGYNPPPAVKPYNPTTLIALSIFSVICCPILGVVTLIQSNNAMTAINSGAGDPADKNTVNIARILSIVALVLMALGILRFAMHPAAVLTPLPTNTTIHTGP